MQTVGQLLLDLGFQTFVKRTEQAGAIAHSSDAPHEALRNVAANAKAKRTRGLVVLFYQVQNFFDVTNLLSEKTKAI